MALEFLRRVADRGHRVSVLMSKGSWWRENFVGDGIDFYFAPSSDVFSVFTGTPYPILRGVSYFVKRVKPDVVHVHSHLFVSSYQAVRAARSVGVPSVVTVHGVMARRNWFLDGLQKLYLRTVARSMFDMVSAIVCLTRSDAVEMARIVGKTDRIFVVPNGVDTDFFKPAVDKDPNMITWVGRFVPEKGVVYLLRAMRRVVEEYGDVKLFLIGDGPLKPKLMRLVDEFGLGGNVVFTGAVGRAEVARLLSRSSIFVFPSLREGMPMALLEAMASGNAIVASNIPGINEIIYDGFNGMISSLGNIEELATTLVTLLINGELREKLAVNARMTIERRYSWDIVLNELEHIYALVI